MTEYFRSSSLKHAEEGTFMVVTEHTSKFILVSSEVLPSLQELELDQRNLLTLYHKTTSNLADEGSMV
jgi:hypothetical protein